MRRFSFLTVHPDFIRAYQRFGVFRAAEEKQLATIDALHLRDFAVDKHGSVDDRPFGGGEGMIMRPEPLAAALQTLPERPLVILTTPQGKAWTQREAERLAEGERPLAFVCGRFGGIDQRFIDKYVDEEWSCGDYVLAGGELPALLMAESILRLVPGVLGDRESAERDSFGAAFDGGLEHPLYTRPPVFEGEPVPEALLSGDHAKIAAWRREASRRRTMERRPDLCAKSTSSSPPSRSSRRSPTDATKPSATPSKKP